MTEKKERILGMARNQDEKTWLARCLDYLRAAADRGKLGLTGFLDPGQAGLLQDAARLYGGVKVITWGGHELAERRRALIIPAANEWAVPEFNITALFVSLPGREGQPGHRDYLGALIGLGLSREKLGDIVKQDRGAVIFAASEIAPFIRDNLVKVGRFPVEIQPAGENMPVQPPAVREVMVTVASARLDAIVSRAFNLSRSEAALLVEQGKVRQNWRNQTNPAAVIEPGDTISCRGYGRFKILEAAGSSRKERLRYVLGFPADED